MSVKFLNRTRVEETVVENWVSCKVYFIINLEDDLKFEVVCVVIGSCLGVEFGFWLMGF